MKTEITGELGEWGGRWWGGNVTWSYTRWQISSLVLTLSSSVTLASFPCLLSPAVISYRPWGQARWRVVDVTYGLSPRVRHVNTRGLARCRDVRGRRQFHGHVVSGSELGSTKVFVTCISDTNTWTFTKTHLQDRFVKQLWGLVSWCERERMKCKEGKQDRNEAISVKRGSIHSATVFGNSQKNRMSHRNQILLPRVNLFPLMTCINT